MKKIVHIVNDDKFIDGLINLLDWGCNDNIQNIFVNVVLPSKRFNHIKKSERITRIDESKFLDFLEKEHIDAIVLHSFYVLPPYLLLYLQKTIKVFWISWGYDVYIPKSNRYFPLIKISKLFHHRTLDFFGKKYLRRFLEKIYPYIFYYSKDYIEFRKEINRIDFYSGILSIEYNLMKKNSFFRARPFSWTYRNPFNRLYENINEEINLKGNNILIGNSADITNNHLDVFDFISKMSFSGNLIVPLSYAGNYKYKNKILEEGKKLFGDKFIPLLDFMPYEEYKDIVKTCSICIYFHERQQAMGNIYMALWNGCSVYLSYTSIAYRFLKDEGFILYSLQECLHINKLEYKISRDEVLHNRKLLRERLALNAIRHNLENFYNLVLND